MEIDLQTILSAFIESLGVFLLGIKFMGNSLQQIASNRLKDIVNRFTSPPFLDVLAGIIYVDMLSNLEHIRGHAVNITEKVLNRPNYM
ncbi:MAG TPA: hypothetical protein VK078_06395 [Pseudogracilibacillus sp.]|nr:hypothetical protein [Pseudogracilibacillus sp.]